MNECTEWRPPAWREIEEGVNPTPEECVALYAAFKKQGYYTHSGGMSKKGNDAPDSEEAMIVRHNVAQLRDAWNTFGPVWQLADGLVGVDFKVDPFHNPGMSDASNTLVVKLDGTGDQDDDARATNGLAKSDKTVEIKTFTFVDGNVVEQTLTLPLPLNWRGQGKRRLKRGKAPAKVNGPHSRVEEWLRLCVAQGQEEIVVAFVPDNGDGWFQRWALTAQLVVRLGRVPCSPPPAIAESSPRGASALLIWVPENMVKSLPTPALECIEHGTNFRVPLLMRPQAGLQYAFVQSGSVRNIVDLGLTDVKDES